MKKTIAFALMWILCALAGVVGLIWMLVSGLLGNGQRAMRIAVAMDQTGNATAGGDEDETFSARCYRMRRDPRYYKWMRRIDAAFLFLLGEKDHCKGAFEAELARRNRPYKDH